MQRKDEYRSQKVRRHMNRSMKERRVAKRVVNARMWTSWEKGTSERTIGEDGARRLLMWWLHGYKRKTNGVPGGSESDIKNEHYRWSKKALSSGDVERDNNE